LKGVKKLLKLRKQVPEKVILKTVFVVLLATLMLPTPLPVSAQGNEHGDGPIDPTEISFDQNVNAQLPLNTTLTDENGNTVKLQQYFGKKPIILIFAYYNCPMLCDLALSDLAQNLKNLKYTAGNEFEVLTISFNVGETSQMAAEKKNTMMQIYNRPKAADGWHFLVGQQAEIDQVTETAGFHYQYDPASQEYAHPTGVIILTPEGKIERYIFGIDYNATDLRLALLDANNRKTASPIDQVFLLCYHYDPVTGKYTPAITNILRIGGLGTVLVLVGMVLLLNARSRNGGLFGRLKDLLSHSRSDGSSHNGS
jgi:protein SCO1/2